MLVMLSTPQVATAKEAGPDPQAHQETCPDGSVSISASSTSVYVGDTITFSASVGLPKHSNGNGGCITCSSSSASVGIDHGSHNAGDGHTYIETQWTAEIPPGSPIGQPAHVKVTASVSGSCGSYDPSSDSVTVMVKRPEIDQLNLKSGHFPKCQGSNITLDDFVYDTDPHSYKGDVEIKGFDPDMSSTTSKQHTHKAILRISGIDGTEKSVDYTVLGNQWYPYDSLAEFQNAANAQRPHPDVEQDSGNTLINGIGECTVKLTEVTSFTAIRQASVKKSQPQGTASLDGSSVTSTTITGGVGLSVGPINVSFIGSWCHSNTYSTSSSYGSGKAWWLVLYQLFSYSHLDKRIYYPAGSTHLIGESQPVYGPYPLASWIPLSSSKCTEQ